MLRSKARPQGRWCTLGGALAGVALGALCPTPAQAHFALQTPASYSTQDGLGSPQKSAPCGQADPGSPVMMTGAVTVYRQGQTIPVTINEKIFHPGHYRVSIASDLASLPADPVVTPAGTPCGSTTITTTPMLPLVADGLLVHTASFTGAQTVNVTLPPGLTCTNCTLQVTEFMSNHPLNNPGGCFYHHCANITILPASDGGTASDAGTPGDASTPVDASTGSDAGKPGDASTGSDAGKPGDASTGSDGGKPGDASTGSDAGKPGDASTGSDGGTSADAGTAVDGGAGLDAGGTGLPDAAMTPPQPPPAPGCSYSVGVASTSAAGAAGLLVLALLLRRRRSTPL